MFIRRQWKRHQGFKLIPLNGARVYFNLVVIMDTTTRTSDYYTTDGNLPQRFERPCKYLNYLFILYPTRD